MRIAHFPQNPANHAWRLAVAQRKLGHEVIVYSRLKADATYGYTSDIYVHPRYDPFHFNLDMLKRHKELQSFDIIHNHGGIWKSQLAYYLVRKPKLFIEYHGTDARDGKGLYHQRLASGFFYSTPDLRAKVPRESIWLPHPIELQPLPKPVENERSLFVHFVSTPKGTEKFISLFHDAFGKSKTSSTEDEERYVAEDAELRIYTRIPQARVFEIMQQADVVLDRWNGYGIYGFVSVEAMAFGKPVVADVNRFLYPRNCPVVPPDVGLLRALAWDADAREMLSIDGRAYVKQTHEASIVAKQSIDAFERALDST